MSVAAYNLHLAMPQPDPLDTDAILGGQNLPPVNAAVLGGSAGLKQRLESESIAEILRALNDSIAHGDDGIDLAIRLLKYPSKKIRKIAIKSLKYRLGKKGKLALFEHEPLLCFKTFDDWQQEIYDPEVGIIDFDNIAYVITMNAFPFSWQANSNNYDTSLLDTLADDSHVQDLQALIIRLNWPNYNSEHCRVYEYQIISTFQEKQHSRSILSNLKLLFFGDNYKHKYRKTKADIFSLRPILDMHPKLEVLQIRGNVKTDALPITGISHESLQTIIIETANANMLFIESLLYADFPALEYLEIWGIRDNACGCYHNMICLLEKSFLNLKYLGLISCEGINELVKLIVESRIIDRLSILDLSRGNLSDSGARMLLECPAINRLHTLNISHNCISREVARKFSKLSCNVQLHPQRKPYGIYGSESRYISLYE